MSKFGLLVVDWPLVLGVDGAGIVTDSGNEATEKYGLKAGDEVFGCTRLGCKGYSAGQEYYLMDARVTIPKPKNITLTEAATLGVGAETACLGLFEGLKIPFPDPKNLPPVSGEWVVVLGGASSVGKAAIQIAKASGYNVVASCSSKSSSVVKELGAVPFDYKVPLEQQVKEVLDITSGKASRVFDAVASEDPAICKELFKATSDGDKRFATTNDWNPTIQDFEGGTTYKVQLGEVGRPEGKDLNDNIEKYIPLIVVLIETGKLKPSEYEVIGQGGFEDAVKAYHHQVSGAGGSRKVLVKIQDP